MYSASPFAPYKSLTSASHWQNITWNPTGKGFREMLRARLPATDNSGGQDRKVVLGYADIMSASDIVYEFYFFITSYKNN